MYMDAPGWYVWGVYKQHISRREIENMKKNMKKVPIIQLKTEIYHNKEAEEAETILKNISQEKIQNTTNPVLSKYQLPWYKKILRYLSQYFTPSS